MAKQDELKTPESESGVTPESAEVTKQLQEITIREKLHESDAEYSRLARELGAMEMDKKRQRDEAVRKAKEQFDLAWNEEHKDRQKEIGDKMNELIDKQAELRNEIYKIHPGAIIPR